MLRPRYVSAGPYPEQMAEGTQYFAGLRNLGQEGRRVGFGEQVLQLRAVDRCFGQNVHEPGETKLTRRFWLGCSGFCLRVLVGAFARGWEAAHAPLVKQSLKIPRQFQQALTDKRDSAIGVAVLVQRATKPYRDHRDLCWQSEIGAG